MSNSTNHMLKEMQPNSPKNVAAKQSEIEVEQSELQPAMATVPAPKSPMDELLAQCLPKKDNLNLTPK